MPQCSRLHQVFLQYCAVFDFFFLQTSHVIYGIVEVELKIKLATTHEGVAANDSYPHE